MVRAHQKQPSEDKKETTTKKKTPQKKKAAETGVWPCKINGCNKQFAREADLKRHQRTTKTHSQPGFACPQCEAAFTRTDALRRHQKSRHNGVIIEPPEQDKMKVDGEEGAGPSGSQHNTPSPTPSKTQGNATQSQGNAPNNLPPPPSAGPSSYYRPHTMETSVALPTSATRLNEATWVRPPWGEGTPAQMQPPMAYHPAVPPGQGPPPNRYYPTGYVHPPPHHSNHASRNGTPNSNGPVDGEGPPQEGLVSFEDRTLAAEAKREAPVIDPSLDASPPTPAKGADDSVSLEMTKAAMEAVLKSAERETSQAQASASSGGTNHSPSAAAPNGQISPSAGSHGSEEMEVDNLVDGGGQDGAGAGDDQRGEGRSASDLETAHVYDGNRPPPMEHMLTEDGEPMLNPAELLTQESLASPPPS
ncbi:hypothetical protein PLICRDRAFT_36475 [Plicaturopsis crispa FD-325 SS-3]|nr:hypothetical protein PLICRDRAFT_36475 [Plicaturopsis crispa FD-325 SS-3]